LTSNVIFELKIMTTPTDFLNKLDKNKYAYGLKKIQNDNEMFDFLIDMMNNYFKVKINEFKQKLEKQK